MESNLYKLSHIQTLQGGKMSAIQWGYYIKQRNENLKSKITIKDLKSFTFVSKDTYNTKVSFDINAKFTYTITENNTQKEITDYLKDNQQLIIFCIQKISSLYYKLWHSSCNTYYKSVSHTKTHK
ncbi:hypothetical protein HRAG_01701 [Helicobacter bilis ATCC 43879]|uniref:Uncharacterized protein n=2 Tax=Helicobacteraceae TaxID=72293 RepID=C3XI05_9HELI|nr:hypothetical protein HRAG_01701 [Helicobacter bilis ATCC 43879]